MKKLAEIKYFLNLSAFLLSRQFETYINAVYNIYDQIINFLFIPFISESGIALISYRAFQEKRPNSRRY